MLNLFEKGLFGGQGLKGLSKFIGIGINAGLFL